MGNKKAKMKADAPRGMILPIGWCVLVLWLCAAPCSSQTLDWLEVKNNNEFSIGLGADCDYTSVGYIMVLDGTVNLLEGAFVNGLEVYGDGTVNVSPGAYVDWFIYAYGGGTVNIDGGEVGYGIWFLGAVPQPTVTVYGKYFEVDKVPYSADTFIPELGMRTVLTGFYENDDLIYLEFYGLGTVPVYLVNSAPELTIDIDIKPGSDTNPINLKSKGLVPVAVLSTEDFDATTVVPETVLLEGAAPPVRWTMEDVDGDGYEDMLFYFKTEDLATVLTEDSTEAKLTAQLMDSVTSQSTGQASGGFTVSGTDKVQIHSSKSKK